VRYKFAECIDSLLDQSIGKFKFVKHNFVIVTIIVVLYNPVHTAPSQRNTNKLRVSGGLWQTRNLPCHPKLSEICNFVSS
jgi:hypothetical protein